MTCTFPIADAETFTTHECGYRARAIYSVPVLGALPRCKRHDTKLVQQEALLRGYKRAEIEEPTNG